MVAGGELENVYEGCHSKKRRGLLEKYNIAIDALVRADPTKKSKKIIEELLQMMGVGDLDELGDDGPTLSQLRSKINRVKSGFQ